jgi:hypothetical protein
MSRHTGKRASLRGSGDPRDSRSGDRRYKFLVRGGRFSRQALQAAAYRELGR